MYRFVLLDFFLSWTQTIAMFRTHWARTQTLGGRYVHRKKIDERKRWTGIQKIIEMLVWKTSFRFPEINLGFVTSARGAEHLTPKKFLGRGSFDQRKGPPWWGIWPKNCQMPGSQLMGGGHGHPWIWLIHYWNPAGQGGAESPPRWLQLPRTSFLIT